MIVNGTAYRTVWMEGNTVYMINQPLSSGHDGGTSARPIVH
jgi:hypothetical protein